jgi:hypothetical protein
MSTSNHIFIITLATALLLSIGSARVHAQRGFPEKQVENEVDIVTMGASYGYVLPLGDLVERFGPGGIFKFQVEYMAWPDNWIIGLEGQYGFGARVKENVLAFLQDRDGFIVGRDLQLAHVVQQQRTMGLLLYLGRLIPMSENNQRSGIRLTVGGGYLQHWVKVMDELRVLSQIEGRYRYGYDRMTSGLQLNQFIGYQYISLNRLINIHIGLDAMQGFTRSRRAYDFQTMSTEDRRRFDGTIGLRAGIAITLFTGTPGRDIYY